MLLVIVGAGASYDSIPSRPIGVRPINALEKYRPPLADQLFEPRDLFEDIMRRIPQVMQIAPRLLNRRGSESVEDVLGERASRVQEYPEAAIQLAAVRFYLQGVIAACEREWYYERHVATNLMGLIDQIERARHGRERAVFVTFNYDRLIENALMNRGQKYSSLDDYIQPDATRLFKLHGSVDWARPIDLPPSREGNQWVVAQNIADQMIREVDVGDIQRVNNIPSSKMGDALALPAISIPVKTKSKFECPESHVKALAEALPHVTTLLTIGWRGAEKHFLAMLQKCGLPPVDGICVGGSPVDAEETQRHLLETVPGRFQPYTLGFTSFVAEGAVERLLNLTWI